MLFEDNPEEEFTECYESTVKQEQTPCLNRDQHSGTGLPIACFSETQMADLCNIGFDDTQICDVFPQESHPHLNEGHAPCNTNNSTALETDVLLEIPHVGPSLEFMSCLPSSFLPSSKSSKLLLSHATKIPAVLTDDKSYPILPSSGLANMGELNGSNHSYTSHTQGLATFARLGNSINHDHTKASAESPETRLNHSSSDFRNAKQRYMKYVPLITKVNGSNFKELLVQVLRECLHQIPLDDFYNLLYNFNSPDQVTSSPVEGYKIDKSELSDSRSEALNLCSLILDNFRPPDRWGGSMYLNQNLCPSYLSMRHNFLAIKIIFDSVKIVEDSVFSDNYLSRLKVYKAYYTICKKLARKYPPKLQSNLILNQSQLGKIIKLKFPNLPCKRFGRRGSSKYYYGGIIWNDHVIDKEIKRLIELPLSDIDSNFKVFPNNIVKTTIPSKTQYGSNGNTSLSAPSQQTLRVEPLKRKPMYSFVYFSSTLPVLDCFPRAWKSVRGEIPQQSQWAKETMEKSVEVLKEHSIDVTPLISKVSKVDFSAKSVESFLEDVLLRIRSLVEISASNELYLHVYLVASTLIFPLVFASDSEILSTDKVQLRIFLTDFVTKLESSFVNVSLVENLMGFANIIKKMISFNTLILSHCKTSSIKDILRAMIKESPPVSSSGQISIKNLIIKQSAIVCHAFNWNFIKENSKNSTMSHSNIIQNMTKAYTQLFVGAAEWFSLIGETLNNQGHLGRTTYDLLFHILKGALEVFHKGFLSDTEMLQLPIKLIENFLVSMNSEFQKSSFQNFAKREHELSKEIFRTWWVHSSAFQEYLGIVAEIGALSVRLS